MQVENIPDAVSEFPKELSVSAGQNIVFVLILYLLRKAHGYQRLNIV